MLRSKTAFVMLASAALIAVALIGQAIAQEATSRPARDRGPGRGGPGMFDPAARMDQLKKDLGATDDEWKALQPKIEKVQTLLRDARGGPMMGMGGPGMGRGGRGPRGGANGENPTPAPEAAAPAQSDVQKKMAVLTKLLNDKETKAEDIKTALTEYRDVRNKARTDLVAAQKDLQAVVTVRQEAFLVSRGMLD